MQELSFAVRPEDAGVSSSGIMNYLDAREKAGLEPHAVWVMRHGKVACRMNFAPYNDRTPHMLFSLSKSFCSAAAGFAVQEGLLSWDTRVIDVLPEKFPAEPSEWLRSITLHHLLTMGSGLKPESDNVDGQDWASLILACDCDHAPGTHFHYNSRGTYLISCMVQKVTGMTCRDYLVPRLFAPLGMMNEDGSAPAWDCCPAGISTGGWGLWLSCAQIARFGQCLLQKGVWDGVQVLPPEWLARATAAQIDNANGGPHDNEWGRGYGYQFWMCREDRYRGDGMFAQLCIIDEKKDMAVCCVSGIPDIGKALEIIHDNLFAAADMPPASQAEQEALQARLAALAYPWPAHDGSVRAPAVWEGADTVLTLEESRVMLRLPEENIVCGVGEAVRLDEGMGACGWQDGRLTLLARILCAPFTLRADVQFEGDRAEMSISGVGPQERKITLRRK